MKKFFILCLAVAAAITSSAQSNIFNHLSVGAHVATTGIGFEVATPITNYLQMRAGMSFMPGIKFHTDVNAAVTVQGVEQWSNFDLDGDLQRTQGSVIFNVYPFGQRNAFFVAAGAYFGGSTIVGLDGQANDRELIDYIKQGNQGYVEIGDYRLPIDNEGHTSGSLRTNGFRPYLGLGYGRPCPNKRVSFNIELGVQFMGKMKVYDMDGKELPKDIYLDNDDDWQKALDKISVYPVLKFTLNGRIF